MLESVDRSDKQRTISRCLDFDAQGLQNETRVPIKSGTFWNVEWASDLLALW